METLRPYLLDATIFLPLLGALVVAVLPGREKGQARFVATLFAALTFATSLGLWWLFDASRPDFQFTRKMEWIASLGISYHVGLDGIALLLTLLTTFLGPIVLISTFRAIEERVKELCIALLVLETAMLGTFAALDLVLFYVFWEVMLLPMYLLIGVWGSEQRIMATIKFVLYTMVGSLLMLVGILYLHWKTKAGGGPGTFDYATMLGTALTLNEQRWLFAAFALAFAIKVPMFPLHTWLPDAHVQAPAAGSAVLAGVLLKMGTFGFVRYAWPIFPNAAAEAVPYIAGLAVVGIVYGSMMCIAQRDVKKLIAYSSVAHLGFVMLGLAAQTQEAVSGAALQMVNHGISTGALFLIVGMLYERRHSRELSDYGGVAKVAPALAAVFMVVTLSSIGLPGTNGFVGEFLILTGTFKAGIANAKLFAVLGGAGVVLGAVYMLWMYQKTMLGPVTDPHHIDRAHFKDLSLREWFVLGPMIAMIAVLGLYPRPFLEMVNQSVTRFVGRAAAGTPRAATIDRRALPGGLQHPRFQRAGNLLVQPSPGGPAVVPQPAPQPAAPETGHEGHEH